MLSGLSFTAPLILGALATLPLIWILLRATPPAPKRQEFPPFIILRKLVTTEQTPDKTPWPLLLLRILAVALVIIGLAGPILNAPPRTQDNKPILLVIDDTWAAAANWGQRRDAIREAAADAEQNERRLFVLRTAQKIDATSLTEYAPVDARDLADNISPAPFLADRSSLAEALSTDEFWSDAVGEDDALPELNIRWLSDGVASNGDATFTSTLRARGNVFLFEDLSSVKPILRPVDQSDLNSGFAVERLRAKGEWQGDIVGIARDGRELIRTNVTLPDGERATSINLSLPLALQNELNTIRIETERSAAAVHLVDARNRRALIGLPPQSAVESGNLLSGSHYIREALRPYASFVEDSIENLVASDASVIVLDDVGALRRSASTDLMQWVERGGVLLRFAGPVLAEAAQDGSPDLLPVQLRGGGRAFGGALTWETPQLLKEVSADSPFSGMAIPQDVYVRRQVLAEPGGETTERSWARLADGTPLVTGRQIGNGAVILFHVTATPVWSDLPVSGVFVEMLRKLTFLSALGPEYAEESETARYAPLRLLDGFGQLRRPGENAVAVTAQELTQGASPNQPPGFYGAPDAPLALNVIDADTPYSPISISGMRARDYRPQPPVVLAFPLFAAALALLLIDIIATLLLSGKLRRTAAASLCLVFIGPFASAGDAFAQPVDEPVEQAIIDATLLTRLAYVKTGDAALDRLSHQALAGLSRELHRRTALEPGPPVGVNIETDDLSVYPFLYWPIGPAALPPSDAAVASIENFMAFGGLILFDTRDDERAIGQEATPESRALRAILSQFDVPPLREVEGEHVLLRSFYLLPDLPGRANQNPVWVQADATDANDGVTPLIIGGRDWASAWATDSLGRPVRPMSRGGERAREYTYRAGVNMVMVAFTGNYKSDQVHTPILLQRMGK